MVRHSRMLFSSLLSVILVPGALAATLPLPAPSLWKLNPAASTSGDKSAPSAENTITVNTYNSGSVSITVHYVGADGKAMDVNYKNTPDGRMHPYSGGQGAFRADGVYTFVQADGTHEYGTLTLSADGHTLTNTYTVKPRAGNSVQVVSVYSRMK